MWAPPRGAARSRRDSLVLREEPPMPEKCVTCGLVFRSSNELDWHVRDEHMQRTAPPPRADGEREPGTDGEREPGTDGEREPGTDGEREPGTDGEREPGTDGEREPGAT